jgi:ribosomal protein S12 methylthiotransferase accessory factor
MRSLEFLQAAPKAPGSFDRSVPLEQTLALIPQLRARYGITRIAEITYLDRIGIPVMSAIVPHTPDEISVYSGKGATRESARVGAVMEAVERQVTAAANLPAVERDADAVLTALNPDRHEWWPKGIQLPVVSGVDLLSGDAIDVPQAWVQWPWLGEHVIFGSSTNGLATGNSMAEAVYHAVCELVERHLWAIGHAQGHLRPRAMISRFVGRDLESNPVLVDDPSAAEIELPTGFAAVDALVERITRAGLMLQLRVVEREPLPILVLATIADRAGGPSAAHTGQGCSWSPEHAAIRALTEAAQTRVSDFLGAREDVWRHDEPTVPSGGERRTFNVPYGRWHYDAPSPVRTLQSFADRSTRDVAGDVALLAAALRRTDAGPVVIVDLSPPDLPLHVVRAIAPRLESPVSGIRHGPAVRAILDLDITLNP